MERLKTQSKQRFERYVESILQQSGVLFDWKLWNHTISSQITALTTDCTYTDAIQVPCALGVVSNCILDKLASHWPTRIQSLCSKLQSAVYLSSADPLSVTDRWPLCAVPRVEKVRFQRATRQMRLLYRNRWGKVILEFEDPEKKIKVFLLEIIFLVRFLFIIIFMT